MSEEENPVFETPEEALEWIMRHGNWVLTRDPQ